jgi:hypothetical protein
MIAEALGKAAGQVRLYAEKLLDLAWDAALVSIFGFALTMATVFAIGSLAEFNIFRPASQFCPHYQTENQNMNKPCG